MQQHRQLSGDCHRRSLLGVLASSLRQFQSPAPQVTVLSEVSQQMLRTVDQQSPQQRIACLGNPQLRLLFARVSLPRPQPQKTPYRPASGKPLWILQRQDISQCRQIPNPTDLSQQFRLRVFLSAELFDLSIIVLDLVG
jgi:hypothetical protein